jgi:hypothetical protein
VLVLTEDAVLKCAHGGVVKLEPLQRWLTIEGRAVLVEGDPLDRSVSACPHATPVTPPCRKTVSVDKDKSYSALARVGTLRVCMDSATGTTDWSKLGIIPYSVTAPGQQFVAVGG